MNSLTFHLKEQIKSKVSRRNKDENRNDKSIKYKNNRKDQQN